MLTDEARGCQQWARSGQTPGGSVRANGQRDVPLPPPPPQTPEDCRAVQYDAPGPHCTALPPPPPPLQGGT